MRFIFSGLSRRTRKRIKLSLLLASLAAGLLYAAESRFAILRLYEIKTEPAYIIPNDIVWGTVSSKQEKCWPVLWLHRKSYCRLIEKYYPVNAALTLSGWGRLTLRLETLEPAFMMHWGDRYWYVSEDGRAWQTSFEENNLVSIGRAVSQPALSWSSDRATPLDVSSESVNIYQSSLPVAKITKWYENVDALGWKNDVKFIQAGMKEGQMIVRLIFADASGADGVNIIFADDPSLWQEAGLAVKKIYPDLNKISSKIFIDTTYKGKILVKNKVQ